MFKTLGGERWFVKALELEINTADKHFDHIKTKGKDLIKQILLLNHFDLHLFITFNFFMNRSSFIL